MKTENIMKKKFYCKRQGCSGISIYACISRQIEKRGHKILEWDSIQICKSCPEGKKLSAKYPKIVQIAKERKPVDKTAGIRKGNRNKLLYPSQPGTFKTFYKREPVR